MANLDPLSYIPETSKNRMRNGVVTVVHFVAHSVLKNGGNHWDIFLQIGNDESVRLEIVPGAYPGREGYIGRLDIMEHKYGVTRRRHRLLSIPTDHRHSVANFIDTIVQADNHRYEFTYSAGEGMYRMGTRPVLHVRPGRYSALRVGKGEVSLDDALKEDIDIIRELSYPEKRYQFWLRLFDDRQHIAEVVSRHLNIRQSDLSLGEVQEWMHGIFNACVPVSILQSRQTSDLPRRVIIRFPLPYKVGEDFCHGNTDEKLRSEAATYIWLHQNCPNTPIPRLFGFGFPGKKSIYFTAVRREPIYRRVLWVFRRALAWISGRPLFPYVPHDRCHLLDLGYLVLEHVDEGKMLSDSWEEHRHDPRRRANLFQSLSRIMLDLAKLPLPRIGSWVIDDSGVLKLANRPLTLLLHQLENAGIATEIPRDRTYTSVEPLLVTTTASDINLTRSTTEAMAKITLLPKFLDTRFRDGPFVYSLTDLHQSNIFVDDDWHITSIIDLEWACSRPIQMIGPPDWLSSRSLEEITFYYDEYAALHDEFVDAVQREGLKLYRTNLNAKVMRACWETRSFWYFRALDSPTTLLALYIDHLQPRFAKLGSDAWDEFSAMLMRLWDPDSPCFVSSKLREQEQYDNQLRKLFTRSREKGNNSG
ncbi:hypothetical protein CEP54_008330 [Fusarium duplospermum]|uniref:DUF7770 domain-containing protein n=1 Tax=Fusarium duplospermum TaxID=1325734 RepID=A0A428PWC5_9HYPO|nr:hypothetical protein CEP54_008330 [Fusarium duplospermum]